MRASAETACRILMLGSACSVGSGDASTEPCCPLLLFFFLFFWLYCAIRYSNFLKQLCPGFRAHPTCSVRAAGIPCLVQLTFMTRCASPTPLWVCVAHCCCAQWNTLTISPITSLELRNAPIPVRLHPPWAAWLLRMSKQSLSSPHSLKASAKDVALQSGSRAYCTAHVCDYVQATLFFFSLPLSLPHLCLHSC